MGHSQAPVNNDPAVTRLSESCDLLVRSTPEECAEVAATLIEQGLAGRSPALLGVATGATPVSTYGALTPRRIETANLHLVLLDEYIGLPAADPRSFRAQVQRLLARPLGVPSERVHAPPAEDDSSPNACLAFELLLTELGGVDVQVLGIGRNGHIGFNEPGSLRDSRTRVVDLDAETVRDNSPPFGSETMTPKRACTQGIATILDSRRLVVLVTGAHKARILRAALSGPITPQVPASAIRLHPQAFVVVDTAAAKLL